MEGFTYQTDSKSNSPCKKQQVLLKLPEQGSESPGLAAVLSPSVLYLEMFPRVLSSSPAPVPISALPSAGNSDGALERPAGTELFPRHTLPGGRRGTGCRKETEEWEWRVAKTKCEWVKMKICQKSSTCGTLISKPSTPITKSSTHCTNLLHTL